MRALALAAAIGAPIAFGVGSVLQKSATDAVDRVERLRLSLLTTLIRQRRYIVGNSIDVVGWLLQIVALTALPVFVVQAFVITSAACTAVLAAALLHVPLTRRAWAAVAVVVAGGATVAASAPADAPMRLGATGWTTGAAALAMVAVAGGWVARRAPSHDGALLGVAAGLAYSIVAVLSKAVAPIAGGSLLGVQVVALLTTPTPYLLLTAGGLATLLYATGLQRADVTAVEAPLVVTELLVPLAVGLLVLGEPVPRGLAAAAMTAGLVAALGGVIALLRIRDSAPVDRRAHATRRTPGPRRGPTPGHPARPRTRGARR